MSERGSSSKSNAPSTGEFHRSTSYKPPHTRRNKYNRSKPDAINKSISTALPIDPEAAERRKQRFANDKKKEDDSYGLISRGEDNRLQRDPQARINYFKKIQQEFTKELSTSDVETIRISISKLTLNEKDNKQIMDNTLMSLRKLREALLKFEPDDFTVSVFLYSIRIATRVGHYQTYVPSISYLLKYSSKLSSSDLNEITNIFALHLAHFSNKNEAALEVSHKFANDDTKLQIVLKAWRSLDYYAWFNLFHGEKDLLYHKMMEFGERRMINHSLKCIQKSYFQLPKSYIDFIFHKDLETLKAEFSCDWILKDKTVVIRSRSLN